MATRFHNITHLTRYLRDALGWDAARIDALAAEVAERRAAFDGPLGWAEYLDWEPFDGGGYVGHRPGEALVIHGHHYGEPRPRIIIQHLF